MLEIKDDVLQENPLEFDRTITEPLVKGSIEIDNVLPKRTGNHSSIEAESTEFRDNVLISTQDNKKLSMPVQNSQNTDLNENILAAGDEGLREEEHRDLIADLTALTAEQLN